MANILVCDDDREIVDAIEIYLLQEGYTIYKAYNGQEAIQILQESGETGKGGRFDKKRNRAGSDRASFDTDRLCLARDGLCGRLF